MEMPNLPKNMDDGGGGGGGGDGDGDAQLV